MKVKFCKYYSGHKAIDITEDINPDYRELFYSGTEVPLLIQKIVDTFPSAIISLSMRKSIHDDIDMQRIRIKFKDPADDAHFMLWSSDGIEICTD